LLNELGCSSFKKIIFEKFSKKYWLFTIFFSFYSAQNVLIAIVFVFLRGASFLIYD